MKSKEQKEILFVRMDKKIKEKLLSRSQKENRSLSNMAEYAIKQFLENKNK